MKQELKTSEEWQKLCKILVIDPDGWDRKNFDYSWYEEKITREEFQQRLVMSTCQGWPEAFAETRKIDEEMKIWKDKE